MVSALLTIGMGIGYTVWKYYNEYIIVSRK